MQQNSRVQIQNTEGPELKILITVLACAISTVHARRLIVLPFLRRSSNCDRHPTCFVLCQLSHQLLVSYREIHSCTPRLQPSSPPNKGVEQTLLSVMKNTYNSICIQTMTVKCTRKTLIQELKSDSKRTVTFVSWQFGLLHGCIHRKRHGVTLKLHRCDKRSFNEVPIIIPQT